MMTFEEYVVLQEGLMEQPYRALVAFLSKTVSAGAAQYQDTVKAFRVLGSHLAAVFGDSPRPSPQQIRQAWRAIGDLPKIGAVIVGLCAPMPGAFMALLLLAVAVRRVFKVSILPTHFEKAYLSDRE